MPVRLPDREGCRDQKQCFEHADRLVAFGRHGSSCCGNRCLRDMDWQSTPGSPTPLMKAPSKWSGDDPSWIALQMHRPFVLNDPVHHPQLGYTPAQRARFAASGIRALLLLA